MIKPDPLPISPGVTSQSPYPTKVTADDDTLIISDAGLHKIFILSLNELKVQVSLNLFTNLMCEYSDSVIMLLIIANKNRFVLMLQHGVSFNNSMIIFY